MLKPASIVANAVNADLPIARPPFEARTDLYAQARQMHDRLARTVLGAAARTLIEDS